MEPGSARAKRILIVLSIGLLALALRLRAAALLPIDYDEDDYLRAAQLYAGIIREGELDRLPEITFNHEHPALAKLVHGIAIASLPPAPLVPERSLLDPAAESLPEPHLTRARRLSVLLGALTTALLAIINPLAGLLLAVHTMATKYTSLVMLEALPTLTSALAVICYERSRRQTTKRRLWLACSALALGLTAASKYVYGIAGLAIMVDWSAEAISAARRDRSRLRGECGRMIAWGLLALLAFWAANPYLWTAPWERLLASLGYHGEFSTGFLVETMHLPFYQPLIWLLLWVPWQPQVFPVGPDPFIAALALIGLVPLWRRQRVHALWALLGLGVLFLWPTKWPQYVLIVTTPWALAAASGWSDLVQPRIQRWREGRQD